MQNLIEYFVRMLVACLHVVFYLCHKSSTNFPPEANVQSFFFARGCLSLDVTKHAGLGQFRKSNALSVQWPVYFHVLAEIICGAVLGIYCTSNRYITFHKTLKNKNVFIKLF